MKKTAIVALMGAALAVASPAMADKIRMGYDLPGPGSSPYGPYQTGVGGEFTYDAFDGWLDLSGYSSAPATKTTGFGTITSFQSFCIEYTEHIGAYPSTYDGKLSKFSVSGGVGGVPTGDPSAPIGDFVSKGTGWLYSEFAKGTLDGYSFGGTEADREASAAWLQKTIWWLEGETSGLGYGNPFKALLMSYFGTDWAAKAKADGGWDYGVYALILTRSDDGKKAQDALYYKPPVITHVPDGGTTAVLLGLALCAIGAASRRLRRA